MAFKMRFQGLLRFAIKGSKIGDIPLIYLEQKVPLFRVFRVHGDKRNLWQIMSLAVGRKIFRPYNFVYNATNHTVYPEDPLFHLTLFRDLLL